MHKLLIVVGLLLPLAASAESVTSAQVEAVVDATFAHAPADWKPRVVQDETQALCSASRNNPTAAEAGKIEAAARAALVYPADGKVMGDWRRGEAIAQDGKGGQFSDPAGTVSGGNCYACHQMAPAEISYGTLGPSLAGYGKARDFTPEAARAAFAKIFNPHAAFACSQMPRFGTNKVLTEAQIKDVVAFLFDPASPVNIP